VSFYLDCCCVVSSQSGTKKCFTWKRVEKESDNEMDDAPVQV